MASNSWLKQRFFIASDLWFHPHRLSQMFRSHAAGRASIGLQRSLSSLPMTLATLTPMMPPEPPNGRSRRSLTFSPSCTTLREMNPDLELEHATTSCSSQTMYRRWTWPVGPNRKDPEPVPGLRDVLSDVGLASFSHKAEAWCQEVGAAFLEECVEECEDLSKALGHPGILRRQELEAALRDRLRCGCEDDGAV